MSEHPKIAGRQKPDGHRYGSAEVIYWRMRRIDKAQGCHASLETLATPGEEGDARSTTLSISQTRRIVAQLRESGQIVYAGSTINGCNVYLFPDRKYDPRKVPIYADRPPLWSTEYSAALFTAEAPTLAEAFLVDGYPVNRRLRAAYSADLIRAAIAAIRKTAKYKDESAIRSHSALLEFFCRAILKTKRAAEEAFKANLAEREIMRQAGKASSTGRWPELSVDVEAELKKFLGRNATSSPSEPIPSTSRERRAGRSEPAAVVASVARVRAPRDAQAPPPPP